MLERVGFTVETKAVTSVADQTTRVFVDHDFDIARGAISASEADPYHRLVTDLSSTSFGNAGGYASPQMDALLAELQGAADDEEIQSVLDRIQALWNEDVPSVVTGASAALHAWGEDVYGVTMAAEYMPDFADAWLAR